MAVGRISTIQKEPGKENTMTNSLARNNKTRAPGTGVTFLPHKLLDGRYATGLDEDSPMIKRQFATKEEQEAERARIKALRLKLEEATGLDLGPRSSFWDYKLDGVDGKAHVSTVKLVDGDNLFDFANVYKQIDFNWLKNHPRIASSYEAFMRGDYGPDVQFYVHDEEVENQRAYMRKKEINTAISKLDSMSPDKRKKLARLMGLPVSDSSREDFVYNQLDNLIKQTDFKEGRYKNRSTVAIFNQFADMDNDKIEIKNLIEEAVLHSIYRIKGDMVYEGEVKVAETREDLANVIADDAELRLSLEVKLKAKKTAKAYA